MKATINGKTLELILGDITQQTTDAIVNAANAKLAGGGGVDGAIHRVAGPSLMIECSRLGGCPTGSAVATGAGNLKSRWVFHAVGPIWSGGSQSEQRLLASAYRRCLELAEEKRCKSLAFPSISTGAYGFPLEQAAPIALEEMLGHLAKETTLERIHLVLFDGRSMAAYESALRDLARRRKDIQVA